MVKVKEINGRIINKHDIEANWNKALTFIPQQGEIIIYDIDENYNFERFKIGDGITNVINLPFTLDDKMNKNNPVGTGTFSMNRKADTTIGNYSYAEGYNITASGEYSHAEGSHTTASGSISHAEGYNTTASSYYQHVQGICNIDDPNDVYAHIVGNGTDSVPSNAHTLDWDGNAWFQGDVYVSSTSGKDRDEGSKKLATEEFVNIQIDNLNLISVEDIDAICGSSIVAASEVTF